MMLLGEGGSAPVVTNIGVASVQIPGATVSVTVGALGVPAGSAIYVLVYEYPVVAVGANGSVADNAGSPNSYTEISGGVEDANGGRTQIFQAYNSNALSSGNTITYTLTNNGNGAVISAFYVTHLATAASPYDSATLSTSIFHNTNPAANQSGTPGKVGELFVAIAGWYNVAGNGNAGYTLDTSNGWTTTPPNISENTLSGATTRTMGIVAGIQINSGTGTLTTQPTFSNSSANMYGATIILGLKTP